MNHTIAITGTSRGLGLEFTAQYFADGHTVFALARDPAGTALRELEDRFPGRLHRVACDVADADSVAAAVRTIGDSTATLDLLIQNAGMTGSKGDEFGQLDFDDMRRVFDVNVVAPLRITEQCLSLLRGGQQPRVALVTSRMGSIADNTSGGAWAYRISKTALNMAGKNLSMAVRSAGIATMVIHPGWVQTDMGGAGAPLSPEESVRGMRAVIGALDLAGSGAFKDYAGTPIPW